MSQRASHSTFEEILSLLDLIDHAVCSHGAVRGRGELREEGFPLRGIQVALSEVRKRVEHCAAAGPAADAASESEGQRGELSHGAGYGASGYAEEHPSREWVSRPKPISGKGLAGRIQMSPAGASAPAGAARSVPAQPAAPRSSAPGVAREIPYSSGESRGETQ